MKKHKILVVGQTPPPQGGQSLMIENLLKSEFQSLELLHVPMQFSEDMGNIGKINLNKILKLPILVWKIFSKRLSTGANILYYPPAGSSRNLIPLFRDIIVLISTRWLFKKVIFHIHAGGLGEIYDGLPWPIKIFCRVAYNRPDAVIELSPSSPKDGKSIQAKQIFIVPNGIEDCYKKTSGDSLNFPNILFVGALYESKGVFDLLKASKILKENSINFHIYYMGEGDGSTKQRIDRFIEECKLGKQITFLGVLTGENKWEAFASADIFAFPTYFEFENLSISIIEAMMFGLPIVTTNWRGNPYLVQDQENGFILPIKNEIALAQKLQLLIENRELRKQMGEKSRKRFLQEFTLEKHRQEMQKVLSQVAEIGNNL